MVFWTIAYFVVPLQHPWPLQAPVVLVSYVLYTYAVLAVTELSIRPAHVHKSDIRIALTCGWIFKRCSATTVREYLPCKCSNKRLKIGCEGYLHGPDPSRISET